MLLYVWINFTLRLISRETPSPTTHGGWPPFQSTLPHHRGGYSWLCGLQVHPLYGPQSSGKRAFTLLIISSYCFHLLCALESVSYGVVNGVYSQCQSDIFSNMNRQCLCIVSSWFGLFGGGNIYYNK